MQSSARATTEPRVAVGLPVYNGERYVADAIESILAQSYTEFELVISDNASEDGTEAICREFANRDGRIRYHRSEKNVGAAPNFNRCLELAAPSTEYFKWSAHDDLISETFLERCVEALDEDSARAVAFAAVDFVDADRQLIGRQRRADLSLDSPDPAARVRRFVELTLESTDLYWAYYGLIRRSTLRPNPNESYIASDQVVVFELALRGKLFQVPEARFVRREHAEAWSSPLRKGRTPQDDATWFDATKRPRFVLPHFTLYRNYFRAVTRSPLPPVTKARCARTLAYKVLREWRNPAGDVKYALRNLRRRKKATKNLETARRS
jgi:glycosyltransferase involved in cell wall biosynthesis